MKSYGLDLQFSDANANAERIMASTTFPVNPVPGSTVYLTDTSDGKSPGHYVFDGTSWITGDISGVFAGQGLIGGGGIGDVTLSIDEAYITNLINTGGANNIAQVVRVNKNPEPGHFGSIKAAIDSVVDSSDLNPYVIKVSPGHYYEDEMLTKAGIYIVGDDEYAVHVYPNSAEQHIFKLVGNSHLVNLSIHDAGPSYCGIAVWNNDGSVLLHKVGTYNCDIGIWQKADTHNSTLYAEYSDCSGGNISVKLESSNGFSAYANLENYYSYSNDDGINPEFGIFMTGENTSMNIQAFGMEGDSGTGCAIHVQDGAHASIKAGAAFGWENAVHIANVGLPSYASIVGTDFHDNTLHDLYVDHPDAVGSMSGTSNRQKVYVVPTSSFTVSYSDPINDGFITTGGLFIGQDHESVVDVTKLITNGMQLGIMEGGKLLRGTGLNILVSAGSGYAKVNNELVQVFWSDLTVPVPAGLNFYLYLDSSGAPLLSASLPDPVANIVLGRFLSDATSVLLLSDDGSLNIDTFNPNLDKLLRLGIGIVFASGCIVTENATTPRAIDVTAGHYFYSSKERKTGALAPVPGFMMCHHQAGVVTLTGMFQVNNTSYDDGVNLSPLTAGYFNKHVLYTGGEGALVKFMFAFGTGNYATLEEAQAAPLPNLLLPSDGSPPIAAIIVQEGNANIVEIYDVRPRVGFAAHSASSANSHSDLLNLGADDHTQYVLVNGGRGMSGTLDMNNNPLVNVSSVNGLNFTTHSSRHLPNGVDPIATAAPTTTLSASSTNSVGIQNSLARSDHAHAITFPVSSVNAKTGAVVVTTTDVNEGTNLYHTTERVRAAITTTNSFNLNTATGLLSMRANLGKMLVGSVGVVSGTSGIIVDNIAPVISEGTQLWSASITPESTASDFLIDFSCMTGMGTNNRGLTLTLFRNSTLIGHVTVWQDAGSPKTATIKVLDSPVTVSPVTYSVRIGSSQAGQAWYVGRSSNATSGGNNKSAWSILEIL